jgi:alginate O-acetyltransferase complex protein AlgI
LHKQIRKRFHISKSSGYYIIYKISLTFILVLFTWIFFRATSTHEAFHIVKSVFSFKGQLFVDYPTFVYGFGGIIFMLFIEYRREFHNESPLPFISDNWIKESLLYGSLIIIILLIGVFDGSQFIYFQF